jgi:hypothetical protein
VSQNNYVFGSKFGSDTMSFIDQFLLIFYDIISTYHYQGRTDNEIKNNGARECSVDKGKQGNHSQRPYSFNMIMYKMSYLSIDQVQGIEY